MLHRFHREVLANWFNSLINTVFIETYGYVWFSLAFLGYGMRPGFQFPFDEKNMKLVKIYGLNVLFGIFINHWFFGPSIVERIDTSKGGYCELVTRALNHNSCDEQKGIWHSVFDASGHYYLILSMSLLLWDRYVQAIAKGEVIQEDTLINLEEGFTLPDPVDPSFAKYRMILHISTILLISIWYFEFVITSLFFHTPLEKLMGLILGIAVPIIGHLYIQEMPEVHDQTVRGIDTEE